MEVFDNENFASEFISNYKTRGFGSMTKNDFEVLLFNLLRKHGNLKGLSNFEISLDLQIPETKVRRLAYESDLKYGQLTESDVKEAFFKIVANSKLRSDLNKIEFVIENKFIRTSIGAQLKKLGHYADSSFNSEVTRIHLDSFIDLLAFYYPDKAIERIVRECNQIIGSNKDHGIGFKQLLRKFLEGLAEESGKKVVDIGAAYFTGGAENVALLVKQLVKFF
ncbi:hypothetical protein [Carboxylicivirga sp. M1479]|uniref:hypothetical protein n=1 Tax=Carboxylicivirga sp. M1479 TaxID=2594476 RepID=UPI0011784CE3|nr:hypothetical protein [Carboxylicivirga sp. M1479]TRX70679.1 hypothetical protein FNN09_10420 [Carboxylicivirga sp. M1479]